MSDRLWVFADGSQAEARVVAWTGPVSLLKKWFTTGEDIHTNVARLIAAAVQEHKIDLPGGMFQRKHWRSYGPEDEERQTAKVTVHANNYGMGPEQYAFVVKVPRKYAEILQEIYFHLFPEIRTAYQATIKEQILTNRTLRNCYGRTRIFYGRPDDAMFRAAYAWIASSAIGDWLTKWYTRICERGWDVLLQLHDATGTSVGPIHERWLPIMRLENITAKEGDLETLVKEILEFSSEPLIIRGESLVIPVDFKVGKTWGDAKTWVANSTTGSTRT